VKQLRDRFFMVKHCPNAENENSDDEGFVVEDAWQVNIKSLRDGDSTMQVPPSISILEIKERLVSIKQVQIDDQRLIFRGRVLEDAKLISEVGFTDGDTIHLVIRPNYDAMQSNPRAPNTSSNNNENTDQQPQQNRTRPLNGNLPSFLHQLFDDVSRLGSVGAPASILMDQLRRNLNAFHRDAGRALNPNNPTNETARFTAPWTYDLATLRQGLQNSNDSVIQNDLLSQLLQSTQNCISERDPVANRDQFNREIGNHALAYRRLGQVFNILGNLCNRVSTNEDGNLELRQHRARTRQRPEVLQFINPRNRTNNGPGSSSLFFAQTITAPRSRSGRRHGTRTTRRVVRPSGPPPQPRPSRPSNPTPAPRNNGARINSSNNLRFPFSNHLFFEQSPQKSPRYKHTTTITKN